MPPSSACLRPPAGAGTGWPRHDGGIFAYGDAGFYGSGGWLRLNAPVVGVAATPGGNGYWLVAADGGIFAYGDAAFYGSTGGPHLNAPVVGVVATPDGDGYSAGGGRRGHLRLRRCRVLWVRRFAATSTRPVVAFAATPDGDGYWLAGADGGIFAYGGADFYGSALDGAQAVRVVGMAATADGEGMLARDARR